jgi:antiphage defense system Thoeris ThsB-like protein
MSQFGLATRVFVSFDFDRDRDIATLIAGQLANRANFQVENWSMKEAAPQRLWRDEARKRLNRSDIMLIVVGALTYRASGVLDEVQIAQELGVPMRQVTAYRDTSPRPVPNGGRMYRWSTANLTTIVDVPRRRAA